MDLGTLLTDLGGRYIDARYPSNPTIRASPTTGISPFIPDALEPYFFDQPSPGGGCCESVVPAPPKGFHYNRKGCITKNRRRRKRLASASDIKDLSSLKTVLSGAQMNTWIATH